MTAKSYALVRNDKGAPLPNLTNAVRVLQKDPTWGVDRLYYDEFLDKIFLVNSPTRAWTDEDDYKTAVYMQEVAGIGNMTDVTVGKAVRLVAKQRVRHIVREWLRSLTWDHVDRIALAFEDFWGATSQPSAYVRAASSNCFIGMVARIMAPGCKLDTMPVFEGKQGIKKSSALEVLGGPWYAVVNEVVSSKDFLQCLRGKWLLEISELQSFSRSDVSHVKSIMSTRSDNYRPSYGRCNVEFPRQCVFAGTTNSDDWGTDETGLRRFWPITCGEINLDLLSAARDQLFAEALHAYQAHQSWWDMPEQVVTEQAERQNHDDWTMLIINFAEVSVLRGADSVTVSDIAAGALKLTSAQLDKSAQMRIGRVLRLAGWARKTFRHGLTIHKAWAPPGGNVVTENDDFVP